MAVWHTLSPTITAQLNTMLAEKYTSTPVAEDVAEEFPWLYAATVVLFFATDVPGDLRDFNLIFGAAGDRVHNVIGVAGEGCARSEFYSSAGKQSLDDHPSILVLLQGGMDALRARRQPPPAAAVGVD